MPDPLPAKTGWEIFADTLVGLVSALAWPLLIIFAIFFFGEPIKKLISRIKSASIAGNTVDFTEELKEVSTEIKEETAELQEDGKTQRIPNDFPHPISSGEMNRLFELGSKNPALAVMEAYKHVAYEWQSLLNEKGISDLRLVSMGKYKDFPDLVGLPSEVINSIGKLRKLRDTAKNNKNPEITPTDAANYVLSVTNLVSILHSARVHSAASAAIK